MIMAVGVVDTREEWLSTCSGITAPSTPGGRGGFVTDVIIDMGLASDTAVRGALEEARLVGRQPGTVLVERGDLTANDLARAIAERHGLHHVDLEQFEVDDDATRLIDRNAAMRYCALPIAFTPSGTLVVALADPLDAIAVSDIAVITKSEALPVVADADALTARIERLPKPPRQVAPPVPAAAPDPAEAPMPSADPPTSGQQAPQLVPEGALDELGREIESLRGELDREREARAEVERERDDEREQAAQTIKALADDSYGELETLRAELERQRGEATSKIADDPADHKDELQDEIVKLSGELESERAERAELERQRDAGSEQAAAARLDLEHTASENEELQSKVEELRSELERDQAAEARQSSEHGDGETEALREEVDELRGKLEGERAGRGEFERRRDTERVQHAQTTRALEEAGSEKEELRGELERERAGRTELERRQDTERVQNAQTTKALDDAGAEIEELRCRVEELRVKRDRDREAREEAVRLLHERRADVARAGDEIERALEGLDEVTEAARSVATRLATDRKS
jgi:chromosome segregation ATPase